MLFAITPSSLILYGAIWALKDSMAIWYVITHFTRIYDAAIRIHDDP
jgi:hypothetical protein